MSTTEVPENHEPAPLLGFGSSAVLGAGQPKREHPACTMTAAELNHLRRLLGWVRCEVGQPPDEMVPMVQNIVRRIGDVSPEGKARLVEAHAAASSVPQYVRAALKALAKTLAARPECLPDAEIVEPLALPYTERTALERFKECDGHEVAEPLERLRFFCSLAMSGQDWLDVEPLFDDVEAVLPAPNAEITGLSG